MALKPTLLKVELSKRHDDERETQLDAPANQVAVQLQPCQDLVLK